jgi:hypothetical protein
MNFNAVRARPERCCLCACWLWLQAAHLEQCALLLGELAGSSHTASDNYV